MGLYRLSFMTHPSAAYSEGSTQLFLALFINNNLQLTRIFFPRVDPSVESQKQLFLQVPIPPIRFLLLRL